MLKHLDPSIQHKLWLLVKATLTLNDIPDQWKEAYLYPIPKPKEWHYDVNNTRPITLLDTIHKAVVKLMTNRLIKIFTQNKILRGYNFAALPHSSTFEPLRIIDNILYDVKQHDRKLWLLFQDMSKAYDWVNIFMLQKAMARLKIPAPFITFITNLFTKRTNQIFTYHGTTDPYNVLVGIDQGEVICPLLWCIYYDPLLCYIQNQHNLGYQLSHSWSSSATGPDDHSLSADIPDTTFIDDTTWITSSQSSMKTILSIADSFFVLNDILINDDKVILLTNDQLPESREARFNLPHHSLTIKARPVHATERILGVWITLQRSDKFIIQQIRQEISHVCSTLKYKKVTDKQLLYVFNAVVIPRLEYRSQLVFLSEDICSSLMTPFRKLFKHKLNLNQCIPNAILSTNLLYNFRSLYEVKVHSMFTNLVCLLNDPNLAGLTTKIRIRQLQTQLHLTQCPLLDWPFTSSIRLKDNIADLLSVLPQFNLSFECASSWSNLIQGGVHPLVKVLPS